MKIYALIGKSGTGKSFHAISLCQKLNIESIIDDGLFIYKGSVICGMSAKKSETRIGAIKTAIFTNETHKEAVINGIKKKNPSSILIIATSDEMLNKILERLELDSSDVKIIRIEDITTEEEREKARVEREEFGKHVVPAPSMQLKKNFAGYFIDPLKLFRGREVGRASERTVVRPPFSYQGQYVIEENVIDDIVHNVATKMQGIYSILYIGHVSKPEAYVLEIVIKIKKGYDVISTLVDFQKNVHDMVEYMTAFNVSSVHVSVRGVK